MSKTKSVFLLSVAIMLSLSIAVTSCKKPIPQDAAESKAYDPTTDPLVNPDSIFEPVPQDQSQIEKDETLYLQLDGSPNTLNPLFVSSMYDFTVVDVLFAGLFTFDKDMKWQVNEDFVESFEESDDHTTFVVKMKPGRTWQDGHPFTAHDVVYSWAKILDPQVPALTQKPTVEPIKECVALDDLTVKFVQPEPLATRHWNLLFPIVPKHIFEKHEKENPDLKTGDYYLKHARFPVGCGQYKIVEWKENDKVVVERWEGYKGKKPFFKRIVFRIIPDSNITLLSFEKEEIDCIRRLTPQQFAKETNKPSFAKAGFKGRGVEWAFAYIGWNMDGSNPFFADKRVRMAMTHAFNIPRVLDKIFYNLATPCNGVYHPDSWMYNPETQLLGYDLSKSRILLDEAGWLVDPDDGWRYKDIDGQKVRFEFTMTMSQGSATAPKMAAILQGDLKKIGIEMKTRTFEWATFLQKIRNHEFQAETAMWGTGTDPDTGWNLWRTDQYELGRNYVGYSNDRIDELFVLGRKEFDFEKRKKIYQEIGKTLYDDQPYTWIYNGPILSAFNKRLHGVQFSPRGIFNFTPSFTGWWVKKGQAKYVDMPTE